MLSGRSPGPLALRSDRGERERGCGRRDEKVRLKHCSIGRSRERVPRGSYGIDLDFGELSRAERRLRREPRLRVDVDLRVDGPFEVSLKVEPFSTDCLGAWL